MINITIKDQQIMDFVKKSPGRARWASAEALKMCGGHYRKKLKAYIETGGAGNWAQISYTSREIKRLNNDPHTSPMYGMGKFVSFKYGVRKGIQRVTLGFLNAKIAKIARKLQYGRRIRVTDSYRAFLHKIGIHLKPTTKTLTVPARPIMVPFWHKHEPNVQSYIEKKFFEKFFAKEKLGLKI